MTNLLVIAITLISFFLGVIAGARIKYAAAAAADRFQTVIGAVVELCSYSLPETSIYSLTAVNDSDYAAGEYLIKDNGVWRNVYLTKHALALMSDPDVIALNPAIVCDETGITRSWHVCFMN